MSDLKQSLLNVAVLAIAVVMGLGAYFVGSRIHHSNQLYGAITQVLQNAKTIEGLNTTLAAQQQQIAQMEALQEELDEKEKSLEPDAK